MIKYNMIVIPSNTVVIQHDGSCYQKSTDYMTHKFQTFLIRLILIEILWILMIVCLKYAKGKMKLLKK